MPASVVGRDAELAALSDFLAGIPDGARALVLEGEAGMGKTTLWRVGVETAERGGLCVLVAQPAESETALSFSGLGDLLDPVLEEVMAPLPEGQRSALARALVLEEVEGPPPDAHAAGVALLNALRGLATTRDVLVAVDDVQWLDAASAAAFAYAARRLKSEHVGLLLAYRSGSESVLVGELRRVPRCGDLRVGSIEPSALHQVVQQHLGIALPRPLVAEVHQASGGNPFYALEIVRMLQRSDVSIEAGQSLPVPDSLHDLVHGRLLALPPDSRDFLVAAAAHAHPTISITEQASGVGRSVGLAPALEAHIVEMGGERIRFTHPLLATGALETADPRRRSEVHARLAELLEDPEARAWQLAASVHEPDANVATVIEDAADHARKRGALRPAALLLDRAEQLTPSANRDDGVRRAVEAAYLHFEAGDARRAETRLRAVIAPLPRGPVRAKALAVLARVRLYEQPDEARELFAQVIDEAGDDLETLAVAHEGVGASSLWMFERFEEALEHTEIALGLASQLGDDALAADVLAMHLAAETLLGRPIEETIGRASELQRSAEHQRVMDQPLLTLAVCWSWTDRHERARLTLVGLVQSAQDLGDENTRPWLLFLLGDVERLLGNLPTALGLAREGQEASEQSGQPLFARRHLALESLVLAELGRADEARRAAEGARQTRTDRYVGLVTSAALGHVALAVGQQEEAVVELQASIAFLRKQGIVEPGVARFAPDLVEALVGLDRLDEAVRVLGWYELNSRRLRRISALANCARCRGMLAAQDGDLDAAIAAYDEALGLHARVDLPLDRARTLLALGAAQRRAKRRREARETLERALAAFDEIGAALWAARARAELKRISGRAATPGALTPAEERVAALVVEGKTNREVAAALFLSDRTVEGHLARIFGKLGIRHRTELPGALHTRGIDLSNTGDSPVSAEPSAP